MGTMSSKAFVLHACFIILAAQLVTLSLGAKEPSSHRGQPQVTVLGLGVMGKAVVQCYAENGYQVHVWNRGEANRNEVRNLELPNVTVHDELEAAVRGTDRYILMNIGGGSRSAQEPLIETMAASSSSSLDGRTLIQFSSHSPSDAKRQEELLNTFGGSLISGAMMAMPQTLCSVASTIFVSATEHDLAYGTVGSGGILNVLGRIVPFDADVGLASLASIGIIQAVTFGVAGMEMAHLLMRRYPGASSDFRRDFARFALEIVPTFMPVMFEAVSRTIHHEKWEESYAPAADFKAMLEMHLQYMAEIGIAQDTYLEGYLRYLSKAADANARHCPSSWIRHAADEL